MLFPVHEKALVWVQEFLTLPRTRIPAIKQAGYFRLMALLDATVMGKLYSYSKTANKSTASDTQIDAKGSELRQSALPVSTTR